MKKSFLILSVFFMLLIVACESDPKKGKGKTITAPAKTQVRIPAFNSDSAYAFIAKQLEFGIRVPGSPSHKACKDWMVSKFKSYGAEVIEQNFDAHIFNGEVWPSTNVIAQFNPEAKSRIILSAHWDSRFIAEMDADKKKKDEPIPGADDGGSGTGVLIELARTLQATPIDLGVDIILWDAEDQGDPSKQPQPDTWCLGSQHWSKNKHKKNYRAKWGINLDMVGSKNPRFGHDEASKYFAKNLLDKVWALAQNMGYPDMFVNVNTGALTDDHLYVNKIAGIPMIDIINQPAGGKHSFMEQWHTHGDDLSIISKRSLKVVGQVVTAVVYRENNGTF